MQSELTHEWAVPGVDRWFNEWRRRVEEVKPPTLRKFYNVLDDYQWASMVKEDKKNSQAYSLARAGQFSTAEGQVLDPYYSAGEPVGVSLERRITSLDANNLTGKGLEINLEVGDYKTTAALVSIKMTPAVAEITVLPEPSLSAGSERMNFESCFAQETQDRFGDALTTVLRGCGGDLTQVRSNVLTDTSYTDRERQLRARAGSVDILDIYYPPDVKEKIIKFRAQNLKLTPIVDTLFEAVQSRPSLVTRILASCQDAASFRDGLGDYFFHYFGDSPYAAVAAQQALETRVKVAEGKLAEVLGDILQGKKTKYTAFTKGQRISGETGIPAELTRFFQVTSDGKIIVRLKEMGTPQVYNVVEMVKGALNQTSAMTGIGLDVRKIEIESGAAFSEEEAKRLDSLPEAEILGGYFRVASGEFLAKSADFADLRVPQATRLWKQGVVDKGFGSVMLVGTTGCGKTAILSQTVREMAQENAQMSYCFGDVLVYEFDKAKLKDLSPQEIAQRVAEAYTKAAGYMKDRASKTTLGNNTMTVFVFDDMQEVINSSEVVDALRSFGGDIRKARDTIDGLGKNCVGEGKSGPRALIAFASERSLGLDPSWGDATHGLKEVVYSFEPDEIPVLAANAFYQEMNKSLLAYIDDIRRTDPDHLGRDIIVTTCSEMDTFATGIVETLFKNCQEHFSLDEGSKTLALYRSLVEGDRRVLDFLNNEAFNNCMRNVCSATAKSIFDKFYGLAKEGKEIKFSSKDMNQIIQTVDAPLQEQIGEMVRHVKERAEEKLGQQGIIISEKEPQVRRRAAPRETVERPAEGVTEAEPVDTRDPANPEAVAQARTNLQQIETRFGGNPVELSTSPGLAQLILKDSSLWSPDDFPEELDTFVLGTIDPELSAEIETQVGLYLTILQNMARLQQNPDDFRDMAQTVIEPFAKILAPFKTALAEAVSAHKRDSAFLEKANKEAQRLEAEIARLQAELDALKSALSGNINSA